MKTKHLLTGLVLPALLAACTAEEVVEQQAVVKNDLSARPIVGNVTLNTGAEGRATLGEGAWNSLAFEEGDVIGARLMDVYSKDASCTKGEEACAVCANPYWNYDIKNDFASSNYKYTNAGEGNWETDALMVEGNYMFYFPYNEKFLGRGPVKVTLPLKQNVSEENPGQAIQDLYEGENPYLVAYNFLPAEGQDPTLGLDFQHIFAYPQITLQNKYKETDEETAKDVAKAITIDKIIISAEAIKAEGLINHENLAAALNNVLIDECENEHHAAVEAGSWVTLNEEGRVKAGTFKKFMQTATTDDIVDFDGEESYITVDIEDITLQPNEKFSFNVVMPALRFAEGDITIKVYLTNNKMFEESFAFGTLNDHITFVPGKRYPEEEYNYTGTKATTKTSAGKLATFELKGKLVDAVLPIKAISNITEFEAMLDEIADNTLTLTEGTNKEVNDGDADFSLAKDKNGKTLLEINDEVMALLDKYLANGEIEFTSDMVVKAAALDNIHFANVTFASDVTINKNVKADAATIESGKVTIADKSDIELGTITVKAGELVVNKANFIGTDNMVVVSETEDEETEEVIATGTLTINKANSLDNVTMAVDGNIAINAAVKVKENNITAGTITNNNTVTLEADWTIAEDVTFENKGKVAGAFDLNNEGTITTTKNLVVNENNGLIEVKSAAVTLNVEDGEGEVNNTEAGMVSANDDNTVYAELSEITSVEDDINKVYDGASGVEKIVATGTWSARKDGETLADQFTKIEFKGATLSMASVTLNLNKATVIISANTTWTGRGDNSVVKCEEIVYGMYDTNADEVEDTYYTLTIDKVVVENGAGTTINAQAEALKQAAANGGNVTLTSDVALTAGYTLTKSLNLNLNGKTLTFDSDDILYRVNSGATLTIGGGAVVGDGYVASSNEGGIVNVTSGTYTSGVTCFQSNGGELNISGGTFKAEPEPSNGVYYTINYIDAKKNSDKIKISGGTFYNFNPACSSSENPVANFLAVNKVVKVYENALTNEVTNSKPSTSGDTSKTYAQQPCLGSWINTYIYVVE